jgi:glycine/D-amino acid oxidase-like deaminating enzyme
MMLDAGSIHPAKYHAGLVRLARQAGVRTVAHCAVEGIVPEQGGGFRVVTTKGDVRARRVALGTNGYTGAATPWHQRRIIPISSSIIATEPLGEDVVSALLPAGCPVIDTKRVSEFARPSPDGTRLLFGGRASFLRIPEARKLEILKAKLAAMFPEVAGARITHAWGGQMGFTFDFLPKTGSHEGVDYAIGCNGGCGIVMMSWLGRKMAGQILGSSNRVSAFRGLEFKTQPFYGGKPWFLPIVGNWYRLRDWWDVRRDGG